MPRVDAYLALIDDPERPPLDLEHPQDAPLLSLLIALAHSDGEIRDEELALIERICPHRAGPELRAWVEAQGDAALDLRTLANAFPDPVDRWNLVRLATRMMCIDGDIAPEEKEVLADLAAALGLDPGAPDRAVREVVAHGGAVSAERLRSSLRNMLWRRARPTADPPSGPVAAAAPSCTTPIATVLLDGEAVAAVYLEGLAAQFESGVHFVPWDAIRTYTRVPVPGASFHLKTDDLHLKMSEPRMRDIGALLDYVFGRERIPDA